VVGYWLVKQEPSSYSWADLENDEETEWDGVHNALALQHIRAMAPGDLAMFYHSGTERACVGILRVVRGPRGDPKDARGSWSVKMGRVRPLRRSVTLAEIRDDPGFEGFALLRISRLSVMPVSKDHWARLLAHESSTLESARARPRAARSGPGKTSASRRPGRGPKRTR